jgi:nitronate monooxygenase
MSNKVTSATHITKWRTRLTALHEQLLFSLNPQPTTENKNHRHRSIPIVSAPMAGHSGGLLAATVCYAGGIGMIGGGHWLSNSMNEQLSNDSKYVSGLDQLHNEITIFDTYNKNVAPKMKFPLCIGFIGHSTFVERENLNETISNGSSDDGWARLVHVIKTYQPSIIQFFAPAICYHINADGERESNVQLVQRVSNHQTKVFVQVGTVSEAMEAMDNGVDGLIVQGSEAGGHGVRREFGSGTLSLVANVLHHIRDPNRHPLDCVDTQVTSLESSKRKWNTNIPILAAGGIVDGTTMAAVMTLGCDGVVVGTRFWASSESIGFNSCKEKLITTPSCDDIVRTTTYDWIQNTYSKTPWPKPYDSVGAIKNDTYYQWENRSADLAHQLSDPKLCNDIIQPYKKACIDGEPNIALIHAGEGIGLIQSIESAYDLVQQIGNDAISIIQNVPKSVLYNDDDVDQHNVSV